MKRTLLQAALAAAFCTLGAAHAAVAEKPSTLADQQSVAVTIYNENLALIKDVRRIDLRRRREPPGVARSERPDAPRDGAAAQPVTPGRPAPASSRTSTSTC